MIRKALKPKKVLFAAMCVLTVISAFAALAIAFVGTKEWIHAQNYPKAAFTGIGCTAIFGTLIFMAVRELKMTYRRNKKRERILNNLDSSQLERLEEQIRNEEICFKTIYLLEKYLFVPKAGILLRYGEIYKFKNILHSTNGINDAVYIEILDTENIRYKFSVKKWRKYKKNLDEFMRFLEEKCSFSHETKKYDDTLTPM